MQRPCRNSGDSNDLGLHRVCSVHLSIQKKSQLSGICKSTRRANKHKCYWKEKKWQGRYERPSNFGISRISSLNFFAAWCKFHYLVPAVIESRFGWCNGTSTSFATSHRRCKRWRQRKCDTGNGYGNQVWIVNVLWAQGERGD